HPATDRSILFGGKVEDMHCVQHHDMGEYLSDTIPDIIKKLVTGDARLIEREVDGKVVIEHEDVVRASNFDFGKTRLTITHDMTLDHLNQLLDSLMPCDVENYMDFARIGWSLWTLHVLDGH